MFGSICFTSKISRLPVRPRGYGVSTVQTCGISTLPINANRWGAGFPCIRESRTVEPNNSYCSNLSAAVQSACRECVSQRANSFLRASTQGEDPLELRTDRNQNCRPESTLVNV